METQATKHSGTNVKATNNFDYSKAEPTVKNISIPNSQYMAKWIDGEGYAIGYENIKVTKSYETLEEALNQIGYGVDKDEEGDEVLVKVGEIDYELIARIIKAINIVEKQNEEMEVNNG